MADEEEGYDSWTVEELRAEASEREIEGRSSMNKEELVAALEAKDEDEVEEAEEEAVTVGGDTYVTAELADEGPLVHVSSADAQRFLDEDGKPKEG